MSNKWLLSRLEKISLLKWVNFPRCTRLPDLVVLGQSYISREIILASILTCIYRKKLNSLPWSAVLRDFQNQEYRFTIPKSPNSTKGWARRKRKWQLATKHMLCKQIQWKISQKSWSQQFNFSKYWRCLEQVSTICLQILQVTTKYITSTGL